MPDLARKHIAFGDEVVQQEHPYRDELVSCWWLKHGTSCAVRSTISIFTVNAAALAGGIHQTIDGGAQQAQKWLFILIYHTRRSFA